MENLEITLVKKVKYELKPFGRFKVKWCPIDRVKKRLDVIDTNETDINYNNRMPIDGENEAADKQIIKFMKIHKTDVLTDGSSFYTRFGDFAEISHPHLKMYIRYLKDRNLEDNEETWNDYIKGM